MLCVVSSVVYKPHMEQRVSYNSFVHSRASVLDRKQLVSVAWLRQLKFIGLLDIRQEIFLEAGACHLYIILCVAIVFCTHTKKKAKR